MNEGVIAGKPRASAAAREEQGLIRRALVEGAGVTVRYHRQAPHRTSAAARWGAERGRALIAPPGAVRMGG